MCSLQLTYVATPAGSLHTRTCPAACAGGVLIAGNLNVPLVWLVASVVAWMFTSASCVAVMEKLPWHDALYFVGSTLTTGNRLAVLVGSATDITCFAA